jgi:hypothetical protein
MYYLVIKNLGIEKCIAVNEEDTWVSGETYDCRRESEFKKGNLVRRIFIRCSQNPYAKVLAAIWHD